MKRFLVIILDSSGEFRQFDNLEEATAAAIREGALYGGPRGVEIRTFDLVRRVPCSDYINPNFPQERFSLEKGMMVAPST